MTDRRQIVAFGGFDDIRSADVRFLEEAAKLGELTVLVWPDDLVRLVSGAPPKFPLAERVYFLEGLRYVKRVIQPTDWSGSDSLPEIPSLRPGVWVDVEPWASSARERFCRKHEVSYRVFKGAELKGFPVPPPAPPSPGTKKVIVTGSYDWLHTGHIRFLEEAGQYGALYAVVGHDANLRLLKGPGHPLYPQAERRYMVASVKYVKHALVATGNGWLDAEPEIRWLKPDIYIVNEDGDQGGKREYCQQLGIEYLVLKRVPSPGLPKRTSTSLRGF